MNEHSGKGKKMFEGQERHSVLEKHTRHTFVERWMAQIVEVGGIAG
jgi:hypothetical protein